MPGQNCAVRSRFDRQVHPGWFIARLIASGYGPSIPVIVSYILQRAVIYRPFREFPAAIISNSVPSGREIRSRSRRSARARYFIRLWPTDLPCFVYCVSRRNSRVQLGRPMKTTGRVGFTLSPDIVPNSPNFHLTRTYTYICMHVDSSSTLSTGRTTAWFIDFELDLAMNGWGY